MISVEIITCLVRWTASLEYRIGTFEIRSDELFSQGPQAARNFSGEQMLGVGITMEGINQNEIMYEFALEQAWRAPLSDSELNEW